MTALELIVHTLFIGLVALSVTVLLHASRQYHDAKFRLMSIEVWKRANERLAQDEREAQDAR